MSVGMAIMGLLKEEVSQDILTLIKEDTTALNAVYGSFVLNSIKEDLASKVIAH